MVAGLVLWSLAVSVFPGQNPGLSSATYWAVAAVAAAAFFGPILLHELGHALAFVGWFLNAAARSEAQQIIARERLAGLHVRDLMVAEPVTVAPDLTVGEVVDGVVWRHRHTTYPVVERGRALGLVPFRCLAAMPRCEWDERTVRDCMLPREQVPTLSPGDDAAEALQRLAGSEVGRALVVSDGRLEGLLSLRDLTLALERSEAR